MKLIFILGEILLIESSLRIMYDQHFSRRSIRTSGVLFHHRLDLFNLLHQLGGIPPADLAENTSRQGIGHTLFEHHRNNPMVIIPKALTLKYRVESAFAELEYSLVKLIGITVNKII